ncbi:MAG: glycosyltransferase [Oscillospiraceae bacterium]|nr:glycosyltransferase [Oscillospiraceae bacterium]
MENKTELPKISVIIPVYNVDKYLRRCLDSVRHQTYTNLEIILVDDGSTDKSGSICDEYAALDERILVIHKENGGVSSARNAGIDMAAGDYIGFVDSDDYIDEDMYEYLYDVIRASGADVVHCGIYDRYADRVYSNNDPDLYEVTDNITTLRLLLEANVCDMHIFNKLFLACICKQVRFEDYTLNEDALFMADIMKIADKAVITSKPKYHYYHRPESLTSSPVSVSLTDGINAYDKIYDAVLQLSPSLEEPAMMRRCLSRLWLLDGIYCKNGVIDPGLEKDLIRFLRKHKKVILFRNYLTFGRKAAYAGLLINRRIYMAIVRFYFSHNRLLNE